MPRLNSEQALRWFQARTAPGACDCGICRNGFYQRNDIVIDNSLPDQPELEPAQPATIDQPDLIEPNKMNKFISRIGVELEGGWEEEPSNLAHDGSVSVRGLQYLGESVSPPCETFSRLTKFIRTNYPDKVDASCGLHVHFSFTSLGYYSMLMDKNFRSYFKKYFGQWAGKNLVDHDVFWNRWNDHNQYCRDNWYPDMQAKFKSKSGQRYSRWNFCHGLHGTAECRLLPCFPEIETSLLCIRALKAVVCSYLRNASRRFEPVLDDAIVLDETNDGQTPQIIDKICV